MTRSPSRAAGSLAALLLGLAWAGSVTVPSAAANGRPVVANDAAHARAVPDSGTRGSSTAKWTDADFWGFVDRRQADAQPHWREDLGVYMPPGSTENVRLSANMLLVHANAAKAGHQGAARQDARVTRLADVLTRAPALLQPPNLRGGTQAHAPGWSSSTVDSGAQHVAIDPQVTAALTAAWEARDVVGMPDELRERIVATIRDVARSSFFAYPAMMLNQWNWHGDMAAYAARVTGDPWFLAEYRAQLARFVQGARTGLVPGRTAFLNAGIGLIYSPRSLGATGAALLSSPEYENLIFSGLQHYDWAISRGMAPLDPADEQVLQQWSQRVLFGDWTHAGALNWDTSLGTRRWHLARYWAFALQGLETLATAQRLTGSAPQASWAAWVSQRALETYEHYAAVYPSKQLPSGMWGINGREVSPQDDPVLTSSRMASTASQLAATHAGARRTAAPPGWFAFDPDAKRLAVSTQRYSTGVLLAHPRDDYGGIEIARLYNADGDPVSGTGGGRRAAFGTELSIGGILRLDSQPGKNQRFIGVPTLGVSLAGIPAVRGTFDDGLVARGTVTNEHGSIAVRTSFAADAMTVERRIRATRKATATVRFPVWGRKTSIRIVRDLGRAIKRKGKTVRRKGKVVREEGAVRGLLMTADRGGYTASICRLPKDAKLRVVAVDPSAASTETRRVVRLSFPVRVKRTQTVTVRLTPTTGAPTPESIGCK